MAIRQVRYEKDEILKKISKKVEIIDDKIKELVQDMLETMYANDGVGLAACQVGVLKQIVVYDAAYAKDTNTKDPKIIINPIITKKSKNMVSVEEGCISYPNVFGTVDRHEKITVESLDLDGKKQITNAESFEAIVMQHEIDHLSGIVFMDKAYDVYTYDPNQEERKNKKKSKKK